MAQMAECQIWQTHCKQSDFTYADLSHADIRDSFFLDCQLFKAKSHQLMELNTDWSQSDRKSMQGDNEQLKKAESLAKK